MEESVDVGVEVAVCEILGDEEVDDVLVPVGIADMLAVSETVTEFVLVGVLVDESVAFGVKVVVCEILGAKEADDVLEIVAERVHVGVPVEE